MEAATKEMREELKSGMYQLWQSIGPDVLMACGGEEGEVLERDCVVDIVIDMLEPRREDMVLSDKCWDYWKSLGYDEKRALVEEQFTDDGYCL